MSLLTRVPRLAARSARSNVFVQSRGMHGEYKVHIHYGSLRFLDETLTNLVIQHIPFDYDKKVPFAIKTFLYLSTGFAIPFVASYYQL